MFMRFNHKLGLCLGEEEDISLIKIIMIVVYKTENRKQKTQNYKNNCNS